MIEKLHHIQAELNSFSPPVQLLGVSKGQSTHAIAALHDAGLMDFGENYLQELFSKQKELSDRKNLRWHFIGRLQSNKLKSLWGRVHLVHSFDRPRLLDAAETLFFKAQASSTPLPPLPVLVQLQLDPQDLTKGGCPMGSEATDFCKRLSLSPAVHWQGFMGIAPDTTNDAILKEVFTRFAENVQKLWGLRRQTEAKISNQTAVNEEQSCPTNPLLPVVSLGMSQDYLLACQWGKSTMVRMGSGLFGSRNKKNAL